MKIRFAEIAHVAVAIQAMRSIVIVRERQARVEAVARELGADLSDPEQYAICEGLAKVS